MTLIISTDKFIAADDRESISNGYTAYSSTKKIDMFEINGQKLVIAAAGNVSLIQKVLTKIIHELKEEENKDIPLFDLIQKADLDNFPTDGALTILFGQNSKRFGIDIEDGKFIKYTPTPFTVAGSADSIVIPLYAMGCDLVTIYQKASEQTATISNNVTVYDLEIMQQISAEEVVL